MVNDQLSQSDLCCDWSHGSAFANTELAEKATAWPGNMSGVTGSIFSIITSITITTIAITITTVITVTTSITIITILTTIIIWAWGFR